MYSLSMNVCKMSVCVCMCVCMYNSTEQLEFEQNFNSQWQVFNLKRLFHLQARIQTLQRLQVNAVAHFT